MVKLSIRNVEKRFVTEDQKVHALSSISVEVQSGEFLILVGPSGCGKSTLLNIIAGLVRPDAGEVLMNGLPVTQPGPDRALVFQDGALFPWLNVRRNVEFGLRQKSISKRDASEKAMHVLDLVGLSKFSENDLHTLSGGMRQRVAIARALALEPEVLLMDEPFSALDALTREDLYVEIQELWQGRGATIVFVTHNVREAVTLGDRVLLLASDPGRLQGEFPVSILRPRHIEDVDVARTAQQISYEMKKGRFPFVGDATPSIKIRRRSCRVLKRIVFFAALIGVWALVAERHVWDPTLFPSPWKVAETLWQNFRDGSLVHATAISLRRVMLGYSISLAIGVPLGVLLATRTWLEDTVGSLVSAFQSLPSICWLPLALLWFGMNDKAILFVVVAGSLVSITVAVQDGIKNLPPTYVRAAQTMGTPQFRIYTEVLLPASLPAILTGAKLGWAYAWRSLMSGELLFVSLGLGQMLMQGRDLADMSQVISVMIVIMSLGLLTDKVIFGSLERHVRRRWGLSIS